MTLQTDCGEQAGADDDTTTDTLNGKIGTDTEMADRSLYDLLVGDGPASAATAADPANDVSIYAVLRRIFDGLQGSAGIATFPAAAAAANNVSLAEVLRYLSDTQVGGVDATTTDSLNGKLGTDTEMADSSLFDILCGSAGIASFPAAAAAGNNVSLAEVVRHVSDTQIGGVNATTTDSINGKLGTDTEMADSSLFDILCGSAGIPSFPTAAEPANNVSLAEAIRWIHGLLYNEFLLPGFSHPSAYRGGSVMSSVDAIYIRQLGEEVEAGSSAHVNSRLGKKAVTTTQSNALGGSTFKVADVNSGRILLTHLEMEILTAAVDATTCNAKFVSNPTVGSDIDLCATLDINADELGSIYTITGVLSDALQGGSGGGSVGMTRPIVIPEGDIELSTSADADSGGAQIKVEFWYFPLDPSANIQPVGAS